MSAFDQGGRAAQADIAAIARFCKERGLSRAEASRIPWGVTDVHDYGKRSKAYREWHDGYAATWEKIMDRRKTKIAFPAFTPDEEMRALQRHNTRRLPMVDRGQSEENEEGPTSE